MANRDLEDEASRVVDPTAFAYVSGGAESGKTVQENVDAWDRLRLRPRMLRDVSRTTSGTMVLGHPVPCPVLIAPTAMHGWVCAERELATARAAARAGTVYVVSMAATSSLEDIAAAAPDGTRWMQLYIPRDRGLARDVCARAVSAGYEALVVTVDSPVTTSRSNIDSSNFNVPSGMSLPNMSSSSEPDIFALVENYDATLSFRDIQEIKSWAPNLPLLIKGILREDDAAECINCGADAVIVSNHGGRQVDHSVTTADALPRIVDAVGDRCEVYVDGGIRDAKGVLKALGLGARAVLLGRSVVWALALEGEEGVFSLLGEMKIDLERLMALCGLPEVTAIDQSIIVSKDSPA